MRADLLRLLLQPRVCFPAAILLVSLAELAIADRKYGLFTGGFGQSKAVDTAAEVALFLVGYLPVQVLAGLLAWKACAWLNRRYRGWPVMFHFLFLFGGISGLALNAQYQLHSYFSDAVDFALIQQLGGGSIKDALLFGKNEIAMGAAAIGLFALAWWIAWRLLRRRLGTEPRGTRELPKWRWIALCALGALTLTAVIPRTGSDAAFGLNRTLAWRALLNLASAVTDFDADGYGLFGTRTDSHPFDQDRHPLALDRPGNGIDEDGYGGDLQLVPIPNPRPETLVTGERPHVVIVVMESTRSDVIGKRIDGKLVAPNLTRIAAEGTGIAPSFSHVGFTTASLKSIFSGRLVPRPGDPSLFTELARSGYRISVFSGQPEDFGEISETVGMRRNADIFVDAEKLKDKRAFSFAAQGSLLVDEGILLDEFDRHLGRIEAWDEPHFVYLNFQSPHFPYHHPGVGHRVTDAPVSRSEISAANRAALERTYWNAVAHADAHLGALVDRLEALGVWENTVLLVTGDHGEALFEKGFLGHGHVIDELQSGTFLAVNRKVAPLEPPIAISDYREILHDILSGTVRARATLEPFMHIGELDAPSTIGMAATPFGIVSLRLDTGSACFERPIGCRDYDELEPAPKRVIDKLIARWGSERWAARRSEASNDER